MSTNQFSRRRFLRGSLAAAGALSFPWASACGDSTSTVPPLQVDPERAWWLQNNFAPVADEILATDLRVRGAIPSELSGLYVRNGSNPQSGDSTHWFLGDGMLHGIEIDRGRVSWYRNRYIDTPYYREGVDYRNGFGPPMQGNHQSNVSLTWHGGQLLASGEVGAPYRIDPRNLETLGWTDFEGDLGNSFTAHSKIDPQTGYLHFFGYFFAPPFLQYYVADTAGRVIHRTEIPVARDTMIHSFAITETDVVFWECPAVFGAPAVTGGLPYTWEPSYGSRVGVMPLGGVGSEIRWVEMPNCYVFHELNAYRDREEIVLDVSRHESLPGAEIQLSSLPRLHRWRIGTGSTMSFEDEGAVDDRSMEFPQIDRRFTGRENRHGWCVGLRENSATLDPGGIYHLDGPAGRVNHWDPGMARQSGEAIFVPGGSGEGEGWLLAIVYDRAAAASDFVVLDAQNVARGPIAEVRLPQRVPHGFHATWVPLAN